MTTAGASRPTVPIRTFELPTETLGTLRAKIEHQKQAMREASARAGSLLSSRNPVTSSGTTSGFYPLPDGMWMQYSDMALSGTCVYGGLQTLPLYGNRRVFLHACVRSRG